MDAEIAEMRRMGSRRNDQLKQLIDQKKVRCRETIAKNNSMIELMNMELETLRLEFVNEEIDGISMTESIGLNRQVACCCITTKQAEPAQTSCTAKAFQGYWTVLDTPDYFMKKKQLCKRQGELGTSSCTCCRSCSETLLVDISIFCEDSTYLLLFMFTGLFIVYAMFMAVALPVMWIYRCCECCSDCCYRRGKRTGRICQVYIKYEKDIEDVYLPSDRTAEV